MAEAPANNTHPDPDRPPGEEAESLLADCIDRLNAGEPLELKRILSEHPAIAPLVLRQLRIFEGQDADQDLDRNFGPDLRPPGALGTLGDYTLRRQIGRGGMGVVYDAWQNSMERQVALKVLPKALAADTRAVLRFVREAQVAGKLNHPNIVRVHGVGIEEQVPYYAMEYVEGETLGQILPRLREAPAGAETPFGKKDDVRYFAGVAEAFADVAEGLQHAHSRGVVHRDVKPSNLILDGGMWLRAAGEAPGNELKGNEARGAESASGDEAGSGGGAVARAGVRGAGAARGAEPARADPAAQGNEAAPALVGGGRARLRILDFGLAHLEGQESLTISGDVVGTPLYMSPEQSRRRKVPVDHRTDIWSLGATLYEITCGRPPFAGRDHEETLSQIIAKDPEPPRRLDPRIPRDLETIILKCLRKEPENRYGTAEALAQDLRRFVRGDTIEARPQTAWDRWTAWLWRYRRPALAAAILFLLALGFMIIGAILVLQEQRRTREALGEASAERTKAERNFQKAREAVDLMLTEVSENTLEDVPGMEGIRRSLLEKASGFYQGFLAERGNDPKLRRETGQAALRLGDVFRTLGRHAEAEQACRQAMAAFSALTSEAPGDPERRHDLARSHLRLGELLSDVGRHEDATSALETSRALLEKLATDHPDVPSYAEDLGACEERRGKLLEETGHYEKAERSLRRAVDLQGALLQRDPTSVPHLEALSSSLSSLASILKATRDIGGAEETYRRALSLWHSSSGASQEKPESLVRVCEIRRSLAWLLLGTGKLQEAEDSIRENFATYQKLATEAPLVPDYQLKLSGAYSDLASIAETPDSAGEARQRAVDITRKLVATYPNVVKYRMALAADLGNLANWLWDQGQHPTQMYRETIEILEEVVRRAPQAHGYRNQLAMSRSNLACHLASRPENLGEAIEQLIKARDAIRELRKSFPQVHEYQANLARTSNNLGYALEGKGRLEEAELAYREAAAVQEEIVRRFPALTGYRDVLSRNLFNRGNVLSRLRRHDEAEPCLMRAIALRRQLLEKDPEGREHREILARYLDETADAVADAEHPLDAKELWDESMAIRRRLMEESPDPAKYRPSIAATLFKLAMSASQQGETDWARATYDEALQMLVTIEKPEEGLKRLQATAEELLGTQESKP